MQNDKPPGPSAINEMFNFFGIFTLRERFWVLNIFLRERYWRHRKACNPPQTVFPNISSQLIHVYHTCHLFDLSYYITWNLNKTSMQFNKIVDLYNDQNTLDYLLLKRNLNRLTTNVPLMQKPVNWFALQINWLISIEGYWSWKG